MTTNNKIILSDAIEREAMANCLQLLSRRQQQQQQHNSSSSSGASAVTTAASTTAPSSGFDRLFTCKNCRRTFTSFQALGGHSASHNNNSNNNNHGRRTHFSASSKPRTSHQCSICGLQFPMGQALGGHMRKHRSSSEHPNEPAAAAAAVGSKRQRSPDHVEPSSSSFDDGGEKNLLMSFEKDSSGLASGKPLYIHELEEEEDLLQLRLGPPVIRTS